MKKNILALVLILTGALSALAVVWHMVGKSEPEMEEEDV